MHYVYILRLQNGQDYIGYTTNIDDRCARHMRGEACTTTERIPIESLQFYAAFNDKMRARDFEKYLKSSSGFAFRNKRLVKNKKKQIRSTCIANDPRSHGTHFPYMP